MHKPMPATVKFKVSVKNLINEGMTPSEAIQKAFHLDVPGYISMLREANFTDAQIVADVRNKQNWHQAPRTEFDRRRR